MRLLVAESISAKTAKVGDAVQLRVIDEVKVGDLVVISNKAPAVATIGEVQHAGRLSRAGTMSIKLDRVTLVTGQAQKIRGASTSKGNPVNYGDARDANDPVSTSLLLLSLPFIPWFHGEEAVLRKGTVLNSAIDGDLVLDRASVAAHQPAAPPQKQGAASVTVYWPAQSSAPKARVFCGNVKVADLPQGRNFMMRVPSGQYWFRMYDKKRAVELTLEPGTDRFLRVTPYDPATHEPSHLALVEHDVGEAEASETRPLDVGKTLDVHTVSQDDLQADVRVKK